MKFGLDHLILLGLGLATTVNSVFSMWAKDRPLSELSVNISVNFKKKLTMKFGMVHLVILVLGLATLLNFGVLAKDILAAEDDVPGGVMRYFTNWNALIQFVESALICSSLAALFVCGKKEMVRPVLLVARVFGEVIAAPTGLPVPGIYWGVAFFLGDAHIEHAGSPLNNQMKNSAVLPYRLPCPS